MENKEFEHAIDFHEAATSTGGRVWLPIVTVNIIQPSGTRVQLPLLYDTGASVTTLRDDLYILLGLSRWDEGQPVQAHTVNPTPTTVYRYEATLEFLGKVVANCPVHLAQLSKHPLFMGLLGRQLMFEEFGFGFWEKDHILYVTKTP